jgi:hypothetical protein
VRIEIGLERLGVTLRINHGYVAVGSYEIDGIASQAALGHSPLPIENV